MLRSAEVEEYKHGITGYFCMFSITIMIQKKNFERSIFILDWLKALKGNNLAFLGSDILVYCQ